MQVYLYNKVLVDRKKYYDKYKESDLRMHYQAKLLVWEVEFVWFKEIDSTVLQIVLINQEQSYKNLFRESDFPKFRSKKKDRIQNINESDSFEQNWFRQFNKSK